MEDFRYLTSLGLVPPAAAQPYVHTSDSLEVSVLCKLLLYFLNIISLQTVIVGEYTDVPSRLRRERAMDLPVFVRITKVPSG